VKEIVGVGIDVVEVERLRAAMARWGDRLLARLFTAGELARAYTPQTRPVRLAARFAAKEAVMKALGVGQLAVGWREIEISADRDGKPHVMLHGAARRTAEARGVGEVVVSLTHTASLAAASAIALTR
jgi:holo-[acyl-carrier protein] synthase